MPKGKHFDVRTIRRFADDYVRGVPLGVMADRHGIPKNSIQQAIRRSGVQPSRAAPRVLPAEEDEIIALYLSGLNSHEVGEAVGRPQHTVLVVLRRRGIPRRVERRQYLVRDDYFSAIDTDEKAYWLGFIAADGCISKRGGRHEVVIALQRGDESHLAKFRDVIVPTAPLYRRDCEGSIQSALRFSSVRVVADLERQGLTERKSLTMPPWHGPTSLLPAFYRGLLDGDGTWSHQIATGKQRRAYYSVSLVATDEVGAAFRDFVYEATGAAPSSFHPHHSTEGMTQVAYARLSAVQAIARLLYTGATVWLDRKKPAVDRILAMPLTSLNRSICHSKESPDYHPWWHTEKRGWYVRIRGRAISLKVRDRLDVEGAKRAVADLLKPNAILPPRRQPGHHPWFREDRNGWYYLVAEGQPRSLRIRGRENRHLAEAALAAIRAAAT